MSTSQYPPEIVSAKNKLKNFDLAEGYEKLQYVVEFSDGIWSINKYLKSNHNTPFIDKIKNLKRHDYIQSMIKDGHIEVLRE